MEKKDIATIETIFQIALATGRPTTLGPFYSRAAASLMMVSVGIVVKTFVSLVHHAFWNSRLALLLLRRLSHRSFLASL